MNDANNSFTELIMWEYRGLAALTAIVEEGNFERAATALSIGQPAVSHRLRAGTMGWRIAGHTQPAAASDNQVRHELKAGTLVELTPREVLGVPLYWHQWNMQTPITRALNTAIGDAAKRWLAQHPA